MTVIYPFMYQSKDWVLFWVIYYNWSCSNPVLDQAIKNGIILPKGHGDLIDRNKLNPDVLHDWNGLCVPDDEYSEKCIRSAEVLVPADK